MAVLMRASLPELVPTGFVASCLVPIFVLLTAKLEDKRFLQDCG